MKYMKLGSKPDAFQVEGSCVRYLSELATDVVINVSDVKFHLHKFPLLSKSNKLQKLISGGASEESPDEIRLVDFPGGPKAFEICAKFCYGVTVTLNPYNVAAARCAAEYLEMNEDIDKGNLVSKIEIFLNSCVLRNWKDSIIVLQTTKSLLPWSENLKIVGRCTDTIASKTSVEPSVITWSYTYNRKLATTDQIIRSGLKLTEKMDSVPIDWWVEDVCELDIDLYKRVMLTIKSKGRMGDGVIGEALKTYAMRWLPDSVEALVSEVHVQRNKSLVETIICLLPSEKGINCPCGFLLKLLKVAILIGADDSLREELIKSISSRLDEASVSDLLIPARPPQTTMYDVELVQHLVDLFVANETSKKKNGKNESDFILGHGSWLKVGKIIDGYLLAIARDRNLPLSSFIKLSQSIPETARPIHDGLYNAIDIFLKEHSGLTKSERKNLCGIMDVKKLTTDASMHAAQNEQLPLRVVVQVLFFEQARAAAAAATNNADPPRKTQENWGQTAPENRKSLRNQMDELKLKEEDGSKLGKRGSKNRGSGAQLLPSRSRRIFDKLWIVGKGVSNGENKSSETSASSQSPTTSMNRGERETKSFGSSSRHRRHSIS